MTAKLTYFMELINDVYMNRVGAPRASEVRRIETLAKRQLDASDYATFRDHVTTRLDREIDIKHGGKVNPSGPLTYGHFYQTGRQDCGNVFELRDFDLDAGTPEEIVAAGMADWDDQRQAWIDQMSPEDYEGLDPVRAHAEWKRGWADCAVTHIEAVLEEHPRPILNPGRRIRRNPSADPEVREAAIGKFREFHRYEPTKITDFPKGFKIPTEMVKVGRAKHTMYRSGKVDPATLRKPRRPVDYIHEHDAGVMFYFPVGDEDLDELEVLDSPVSVPRNFANAQALVKLGDSIGGAFQVDGDDEPWEIESVAPMPELYCTTDGKCLLVIQRRREVLAMIWGGALGVFGRGIDG